MDLITSSSHVDCWMFVNQLGKLKAKYTITCFQAYLALV